MYRNTVKYYDGLTHSLAASGVSTTAYYYLEKGKKREENHDHGIYAK
jgi:hypothetical protein